MNERPTADDAGFTLVELMIVMILVGLLAAIAVPAFLAQRGRAVEASMLADLRTVAAQLDTDWGATQSYGPSTAPAASPAGVTLSSGNLVEVVVRPAGGSYCLIATRVAGAPNDDKIRYFDSGAGGVLPADPDGVPTVAEGTACS